jgi:hypothetical protein
MSALIGIEYLDNFDDVRAAGAISDGGQNLSCPYYIANWFGPTLVDAGHRLKFLNVNHAVNERHLRDVSNGGDDNEYADSVDLYFIITHGDYTNGELLLLFDTKVDDWIGHSKTWKFGDTCNMEWLLIYGCDTIDGDHVQEHLHLFRRMHLFCGSYGDMFDSPTIDEVGEDTATNLTSGKTVTDSWGDGVSDWWVSNHPMVLSVENRMSYNNGNVDWEATMIGCDHLWGEGFTLQDIQPADQYWMATMSWDGGIYG